MSKYTTGEIAKLCGITVRTVQCCDARSILVPSALSEGGRRLYSKGDLQRMKVICFLRHGGPRAAAYRQQADLDAALIFADSTVYRLPKAPLFRYTIGRGDGMFSIDKQQFGRFVAALRKELGLTQRELAERLFISDKAVSKWETGASMPDIALLTPLADTLGVTVAELLACRRLEDGQAMNSTEVEHLVQKALTLGEDAQDTVPKARRTRQYLLCLALCALELVLLLLLGRTWRQLADDLLVLPLALGAVFGLYFFLFARERLPAYYDEHRISSFAHGPLRLNLTGLVYFNNRNWPHILRVCRVWCGGMMALAPLLYLACSSLLPVFWQGHILSFWLFLILGGLLVPIVIVGRKYE